MKHFKLFKPERSVVPAHLRICFGLLNRFAFCYSVCSVIVGGFPEMSRLAVSHLGFAAQQGLHLIRLGFIFFPEYPFC